MGMAAVLCAYGARERGYSLLPISTGSLPSLAAHCFIRGLIPAIGDRMLVIFPGAQREGVAVGELLVR